MQGAHGGMVLAQGMGASLPLAPRAIPPLSSDLSSCYKKADPRVRGAVPGSELSNQMPRDGEAVLPHSVPTTLKPCLKAHTLPPRARRGSCFLPKQLVPLEEAEGAYARWPSWPEGQAGPPSNGELPAAPQLTQGSAEGGIRAQGP